ncbi:MAG: DUF1240 domain-containing protein [Ruminococcus sp.]|nr:DUF1240 domain-containing protein [Ruminococcus sp.]
MFFPFSISICAFIFSSPFVFRIFILMFIYHINYRQCKHHKRQKRQKTVIKIVTVIVSILVNYRPVPGGEKHCDHQSKDVGIYLYKVPELIVARFVKLRRLLQLIGQRPAKL